MSAPVKVSTLSLLVLLASCTSDFDALTPAQREVVAAYVSGDAPSPTRPLDADIGRRAKLLGYDLDRESWHPGETMRVTWYWQVLAPFERGAALFTRIEDSSSARALDQNGNGALRRLYGPEHWRAGEYVRDVQDLHLPDDWRSDSAKLYVGITLDGKRAEVTGTTPHSKDRVFAVSIPTPPSSAALDETDELPLLLVLQTNEPPRLDGALLEPVWSVASTTGPFVETRYGGPASVTAIAKLLWDKRYLYVGVEVRDPLLRASEVERDARLWEQDCVELMIDPDGDGRDYFEIQVSPRGAVFDTRYDERRVPRPFGHRAWDSGARVGVITRGTIDDDVADDGYTVEIAIPWQAFSIDAGSSVVPAVGDRWRANVYVMDLGADGQRAAAWSPLGVGDFHVPRRFGILSFVGPSDDMPRTNGPAKVEPRRVPGTLHRKGRSGPSVRDTMNEKRQIGRALESTGDDR